MSEITDNTIKYFLRFVNANWFEVNVALSPDAGHTINDWIQANWELLVESKLVSGSSGFLDVYGEGADCNLKSSRVLFPNAIPTHEIICVPVNKDPHEIVDLLSEKTKSPGDYVFDQFVGWKDGKYFENPPFDCAMLAHRNRDEYIVVPVSSIVFQLLRKATH